MSAIREKALLLGERETMLGITSEPAGGPRADTPLFLLLNSGIVHRIGPHRKTVQLARGLARAGFRAVRVDLSGIGDSPARRDNLDFGASAQADIQELLAHLETLYGVNRFNPIGLCSGADNAYQAAIVDERVVGAVFLDGYAYQTPEYYLRHYGKRLAQQQSVLGLAKRVADKAQGRLRTLLGEEVATGGGAALSPPAQAVPDYVRAFPPREEVARQLRQLIQRGFQMFWVYSGGVVRYYNYENQFRDSFKEVDFEDLLQVKYFANANHTFTALRSQRELVDTVVAWATRTY